MKKSVLLTLSALFVLAGCGGSGSSTPVAPITPYAGSYAANLTAPANSALLVVLQANGSAQVVIADSTGILASGSGTVTGSTLTVSVKGSAGTIQVSTSFKSSKTAVSQLSGSATESNISDTLVAAAGQSPFAGAYTTNYVGTNGGTANMMITSGGTLSGNGMANGKAVAFNGMGQLSGLISFTGTIKVSGTTVTSTFAGSVYLTQVNTFVGPKILGSGTWKDSNGGSGTWSTSNIIG